MFFPPLQRKERRKLKGSKHLFLVFSLLLLGCGNNGFSDLNAKLEDLKNKPTGTIEAAPEFRLYQNFTYSATLLRSPFQPPVEVEPLKQRVVQGKKVQPDFNRPKEVLEYFSLESLLMVGTIRREDDTLFALIQDGKSGVHRVKVGNYIGHNHGRVTMIESGKVKLVELISDSQGGWVERPRTLVIRDDNA